MKFPNLIILDEITNDEKLGDFKSLLVCKLDWSDLDNHKIERNKNWILQFLLEKRSKDEEKILKLIIDEYDWTLELYPNQFKDVFKITDSFKCPKSYYEEIKHFENLALSEWNRIRKFDTNVREECLTPAIVAVSVYFYLIKDALHVWNYYDSEIIQILHSVSLFRFWKGQTGSELVSERALEKVNKKTNDNLYQTLKLAFEECLELSVVPMRNETKLREMIKIRIRDEKIKDILK